MVTGYLGYRPIVCTSSSGEKGFNRITSTLRRNPRAIRALSVPAEAVDKEQGGLVREKRLAPTILSRPAGRRNKRKDGEGGGEGEWKSGTWVEQGSQSDHDESPVV